MNRARCRSIAATFGVAAVALAGCSSGASTAAPATPAPTTAVAVTPIPATPAPATPAPTAIAAADVCTASEASGDAPLAAGDYRFAQSTPAFTFTLPDSYRVACSLSSVSLFGPAGTIVIVTDVGFVNEPGSPTRVDATVAAVQAAVVDTAATATEPTVGKLGPLDAVELLITPTDTGFVVKGTDERGWAFGTADAPSAAISIAESKPGTIVLVLRHGIEPVAGADAPAAVGDDVLASLAWE